MSLYDGMHEANPEEVAALMGSAAPGSGKRWADVVAALRSAGASILLPDPPRDADLHEHDGTVTRYIEVTQDDALHRVSVRSLNDAGYVVIKRADSQPGEHGFVTIEKGST